jgi:signal transduction histidine kinase
VEVPDHATATQLFRIAQEAVSNALRHARPRHVNLTLLFVPAGLFLSIQDDGSGMQPHADQGNGMGLRIMQYRAQRLGAALRIGPAEGGGTVVTCMLPQQRNGHDEENRRALVGQSENPDRG